MIAALLLGKEQAIYEQQLAKQVAKNQKDWVEKERNGHYLTALKQAADARSKRKLEMADKKFGKESG